MNTTDASDVPAGPAPEAGTLRAALRTHPAGPEIAAALGALVDRPAPAAWPRWSPARREAYLDAALDAALVARGKRPTARGAGAAPPAALRPAAAAVDGRGGPG